MCHEKEKARPALLVESEELSYDVKSLCAGDNFQNANMELNPPTEVLSLVALRAMTDKSH